MTYFESTVKSYEVHAREKGGKIVFRIWDGKTNTYVTDEMEDKRAVANRLAELEAARLDEQVVRQKEKISDEAMERVANAEEDGFESPFVTSGKLTDPWKTEGRKVTRGLC